MSEIGISMANIESGIVIIIEIVVIIIIIICLSSSRFNFVLPPNFIMLYRMR